jgi:predicted  nucleic acid-binding Zn-ribbon protein
MVDVDKEAQFRNQIQENPILDIIDEEDVSLGLQLTLREAAKEYQMLEEQEEQLTSYEDSVHALGKELELLKAEIKGFENELAYLESQRETELYYLNGALIINRAKKEELEMNIEMIDNRKVATTQILSQLKSQELETEQKFMVAQGDLKKLIHVRMRIKALFHRVFRHPNSSFHTEEELFQDCQMLKAQIQTDNKQLRKLMNARDQIMTIVRAFSQSFIEISQVESEKDRHSAFTLLVCRTRVDYAKVKKCHSCIPKEIPPVSKPSTANATPYLKWITLENQFSQEELAKAIEDQQMILTAINSEMNKIKRNCNSLESELARKKLHLEHERRRIFHSLIFSWERQRVSLEGSAKEPDLPPPYEEVPAYELDSDEELENCPLQFLKRSSVLDLRNPSSSLKSGSGRDSQSRFRQKRPKRTSVPLIELIDRIRSTSIDIPTSTRATHNSSLPL